jgi:hypothetical protein
MEIIISSIIYQLDIGDGMGPTDRNAQGRRDNATAAAAALAAVLGSAG